MRNGKRSETPDAGVIPREIVLCGGGNHSSCPTVTITETEVAISDDYGGMVRLTREEFERLRAIRP